MTTEHEEASLLSALLDGELEGPERVRLQRHLSSCSPCALELESLRRVKMVLARAPQKSMPAEWTQVFPQTSSARYPFASKERWIFSQNWIVPALVAAVVSLAVSLWVFQSRPLFPLQQSLSFSAHIQDPNPASASSLAAPPISANLNQPQSETP